ncbi:hypothetical protein SMICM17S_01296 [Streptomyces microflavus]
MRRVFSVRASTAVTSKESWSVAYTSRPSGETSTSKGRRPTGAVPVTSRLAVSMTSTVPLPSGTLTPT